MEKHEIARLCAMYAGVPGVTVIRVQKNGSKEEKLRYSLLPGIYDGMNHKVTISNLREFKNITEDEVRVLASYCGIQSEYKPLIEVENGYIVVDSPGQRRILSIDLKTLFIDSNYSESNHLHVYQKLVELRFAIPYMGRSVEELVKLGVYKFEK